MEDTADKIMAKRLVQIGIIDEEWEFLEAPDNRKWELMEELLYETEGML